MTDEHEHDDWREAYLRRALTLVEQSGWGAQGVFPTEQDPASLTWTYTFGLSALPTRHPEIVVTGLPVPLAHRLLAEVAARAIDGAPRGERLWPGRVDDVIEGLPAWLIPVTDVLDPRAPLTVATELAELAGWPQPVSALQLVWPDPDGRFPWEGGEDLGQLLLGPAPDAAAAEFVDPTVAAAGGDPLEVTR